MLRALNLTPQSHFATPLRRRRTTTTSAAVSQAAPPADNKSLYEVLRVKRGASHAEIRTAYRTLAKLYHPDAISRFMESPSTDGRDFVEIHNAYSTLSDPGARAIYDFNLNGNSLRRWNNTGFHGRSRRWETDQCW